MAGSNLSVLLLVLPTLLIACVGLATIVRGWRGRRVGDHPHCRHCRFDLFGSPESSDRCPECGADLTRPRARVMGVRQRRIGGVVAGAALLVCALGFAGLVGGGTLQATEWGKLRPTWYAMREARGSLPGSRSGAIAVLISRADDGTLDAEHRTALARLLIAMHADTTAPWTPTWGGWLVEQMAADRLAADDRDQLLRELFPTATLQARQVVRVGEEVPLVFSLNAGARPIAPRNVPIKGPSAGNVTVALHTPDDHLLIDGRELPHREIGDSNNTSVITISKISGFDRLRPEVPLTPGLHRIELRTVARIGRGFNPRDPNAAICEIPVNIATMFTVVPANAVDVTRVANSAFAPGVKTMLSPQVQISRDGSSGDVMLNYNAASLPMGVGFDVSVRQGDVTEHVGTFSVAPSTSPGSGGWDMFFDAKRLHPGTLDVRLVPSEDAARNTLDVFQIWDGELEFHDVPIGQR